MSDEPIHLCRKCGWWKPVSDFGKIRNKNTCRTCVTLIRGKATRGYYAKARTPGTPENEAAMAKLMKPPKTIKQCRDISRLPYKKRKRFRNLPKEVRREAERLLAIYVKRRNDAGETVIPTWRFAAMCAAASGVAQMRARGITHIPWHIWHMRKMKLRLLTQMGLREKKWTKEASDEWWRQKEAEATKRAKKQAGAAGTAGISSGGDVAGVSGGGRNQQGDDGARKSGTSGDIGGVEAGVESTVSGNMGKREPHGNR